MRLLQAQIDEIERNKQAWDREWAIHQAQTKLINQLDLIRTLVLLDGDVTAALDFSRLLAEYKDMKLDV